MKDFESVPLGHSGQPTLSVRAAKAGDAADFFGAGDALVVLAGPDDLGAGGNGLVGRVATLVDGDLGTLAPPSAKSTEPESSRRTYVYPWGGKRRRLLAAALEGTAGPAGLRVQGDKLMRELRNVSRQVGIVLGTRWADDEESVAALVEGLFYGNFAWHKYKTSDKARGVEEVVLLCDGQPGAALEAAIAQASAIAGSGMVAKALTLEPADRVYPETLARRATEIADELEHVRCESWSAERIRDERLNGLLTVGRGSSNPVSQLEWIYEPEGGFDRTIVLVGKGVTYDCGGLQDKGSQMNHMNRDMGGAAAIVGMMSAVNQLRPKMRVIGLAGGAENMSGPNAYKTDDVITHRDGKTSQIGHTDAEGRVVLYDQLVYARETYDPDLVIDVATLTGAIRFALGTDTFGVFCNKAGTTDRDAFIAATRRAGEKAWPMPLSHDLPNSEFVVANYKKNFNEVMEGKVSDLDNDGDREYGAGSSKGAAYLASAIDEQCPWLHLDVAFTAMNGPMGSPVPSLCYLLMDH